MRTVRVLWFARASQGIHIPNSMQRAQIADRVLCSSFFIVFVLSRNSTQVVKDCETAVHPEKTRFRSVSLAAVLSVQPRTGQASGQPPLFLRVRALRTGGSPGSSPGAPSSHNLRSFPVSFAGLSKILKFNHPEEPEQTVEGDIYLRGAPLFAFGFSVLFRAAIRFWGPGSSAPPGACPTPKIASP